MSSGTPSRSGSRHSGRHIGAPRHDVQLASAHAACLRDVVVVGVGPAALVDARDGVG